MGYLFRPMLLTLAVFVVAPATCEAKKLMFFTSGDAIHDYGTTPKAALLQKKLIGDRVGFMYRYYGIFWLDFWRCEGKYCIHNGEKRALEISRAEAATLLGKNESELGTPFWYDYPPGLVIVAGLAVLLLPPLIIMKLREKSLELLMREPRYERAISIYYQKAHPEMYNADGTLRDPSEPIPVEQALEDSDPERLKQEAWTLAIQHLVDEGVERTVAEKKFREILDHLDTDSSHPGAT